MKEVQRSLAFTTEVSVLRKVIGNVVGAVERRSSIPILANVLITALDGVVTFTGTDLEMAIVDTLPASDCLDGSVTVDAAMLRAIASKLGVGDQVRFAVLKEKLSIESGYFSAELFCISATEFPSLTKSDVEFPHLFYISGKRLKGMLDRTVHAISVEETRYYLNGVYFHPGEGDELRMIATDGHRMAVARADALGLAGFPSMILPKKAALLLRKLLARYAGDVLVEATAAADMPSAKENAAGAKLAVAPQRLRFSFGAMVIQSKPIDGPYPDYARVIPARAANVLKVQKKEMTVALGRAAVISPRYAALRMTVGAADVTLSVQDACFGSSSVRLNGSTHYSGQAHDIGFQARYLQAALEVCGDDVEILFQDGAAPMVIQTVGDESMLEIIMPMRL